MPATPQASPAVSPSSPHDAVGSQVAGGPPPAECQPFVLPALEPTPPHDTPPALQTIRLRVVLGRVHNAQQRPAPTLAGPHWRLDTRDTDPIELWRANERVAVGWLHRIDGKLAIRVTRVGPAADHFPTAASPAAPHDASGPCRQGAST